MATIAKAAEIIDAHPELADFVGGIPFEEVWVAEKDLGVTFPESYRDFVQKNGAGSFGGQTVYGLGVPDNGLPHVVWATNSLSGPSNRLRVPMCSSSPTSLPS